MRLKRLFPNIGFSLIVGSRGPKLQPNLDSAVETHSLSLAVTDIMRWTHMCQGFWFVGFWFAGLVSEPLSLCALCVPAPTLSCVPWNRKRRELRDSETQRSRGHKEKGNEGRKPEDTSPDGDAARRLGDSLSRGDVKVACKPDVF